MAKHNVPMTKAGLEKLQQELKELESVKRDKAKQRIKRARSFCDFHEDSEYEAALQEYDAIEKRISEINYMTQQAEIIEKTSNTTVELGSTVTFKEIPDGNTETYTIVGTAEADPFEAKISNVSPIAKSLIGAKAKDEITVKTPAGNRQVKIINIT